MSLNVCLSCSRHVRDSVCPFCGAEVPAAPAAAKAPRVARIVLLGGAAAIATACSSAQPLYGAPMPDASPNDGASQNDTGPAPMYGAVPPDASGDTGPAPAYGAVPSDAGDQ